MRQQFLYVNGQDIGALTLGLLTEAPLLETFTVGPEKFLESLDGFLTKHDLSVDTLDGALVITGPGSATALRGSLAIMNTLAFTSGLALFGHEKPKEQSDLVFIQSLDLSKLPAEQGELEPVYAHEPRITRTNRDALRRLKPNP